MAHSKSALKRWRQNERARARNKGVRSSTRSAVKNARAAIADGDDADAAIKEAMRVLDRAAKHNVIHKNAASRHKSRLMVLKNRSAQAPTEEAPKRARRGTSAATKKTATKRATKTRTKS